MEVSRLNGKVERRRILYLFIIVYDGDCHDPPDDFALALLHSSKGLFVRVFRRDSSDYQVKGVGHPSHDT